MSATEKKRWKRLEFNGRPNAKNLNLLKKGEKATLSEGYINSLLNEKIKNLRIREISTSA